MQKEEKKDALEREDVFVLVHEADSGNLFLDNVPPKDGYQGSSCCETRGR